MSEAKKPLVAGPVGDFPVGRFKIIELGGRQIGITQLKDGQFRAVRNVCPHKGAPVCLGPISGTQLPSDVGQLIYAGRAKCWPAPGMDLNLILILGKNSSAVVAPPSY
jgi:3-phenylpropionate/trans-cinnamate dioxygenase ferredoxin subunit